MRGPFGVLLLLSLYTGSAAFAADGDSIATAFAADEDSIATVPAPPARARSRLSAPT